MNKVSNEIETYDISKMKQESILRLLKNKNIKAFLRNHQLNTNIMNDYWVEFLDYEEDSAMCEHCQSLDTCPKASIGMKKVLSYYDDQIVLEMESCSLGKKLQDKRELLDKFISNMNESILLTNLFDLDIVKNIDKLPQNDLRSLTMILKYVDQSGDKGLYLHGDDPLQNITLMAGMMNQLALKGYDVGIIHFPTFLIDLKSSFSTNESNDLEEIMKVDYLLLDSIGEENVTSWSRDEILLTILSYRLINHLPTFFTSIYGYNDLKKVYTLRKGDEIKAKAIISKIKALTNEIMQDLT
ncbi:MAG: ATP-binding protein [Erysipelotrichaceae bacterium]|nr:ATP-binding protein [Erysipelotrichaceae bacterium]